MRLTGRHRRGSVALCAVALLLGYISRAFPASMGSQAPHGRDAPEPVGRVGGARAAERLTLAGVLVGADSGRDRAPARRELADTVVVLGELERAANERAAVGRGQPVPYSVRPSTRLKRSVAWPPRRRFAVAGRRHRCARPPRASQPSGLMRERCSRGGSSSRAKSAKCIEPQAAMAALARALGGLLRGVRRRLLRGRCRRRGGAESQERERGECDTIRAVHRDLQMSDVRAPGVDSARGALSVRRRRLRFGSNWPLRRPDRVHDAALWADDLRRSAPVEVAEPPAARLAAHGLELQDGGGSRQDEAATVSRPQTLMKPARKTAQRQVTGWAGQQCANPLLVIRAPRQAPAVGLASVNAGHDRRIVALLAARPRSHRHQPSAPHPGVLLDRAPGRRPAPELALKTMLPLDDA